MSILRLEGKGEVERGRRNGRGSPRIRVMGQKGMGDSRTRNGNIEGRLYDWNGKEKKKRDGEKEGEEMMS